MEVTDPKAEVAVEVTDPKAGTVLVDVESLVETFFAPKLKAGTAAVGVVPVDLSLSVFCLEAPSVKLNVTEALLLDILDWPTMEGGEEMLDILA